MYMCIIHTDAETLCTFTWHEYTGWAVQRGGVATACAGMQAVHWVLFEKTVVLWMGGLIYEHSRSLLHLLCSLTWQVRSPFLYALSHRIVIVKDFAGTLYRILTYDNIKGFKKESEL